MHEPGFHVARSFTLLALSIACTTMSQSSCLAATVSFSYIWLCLLCLGLKFHIIFILWVRVVLQICRSDFIVDKDKMPHPLVLQTVLRNLVAIHLPNLDRCKVGLDIVQDRGWSGYCSRSDLNFFKEGLLGLVQRERPPSRLPARPAVSRRSECGAHV